MVGLDYSSSYKFQCKEFCDERLAQFMYGNLNGRSCNYPVFF